MEYGTLKQIEKLDKNITELCIFGNKFVDINFLEYFKELTYLKMEGLNNIKDLTPIKHLNNLVKLEIMTTPGWDGSGKRLYYETLEPIKNLNKIEYLRTIDIEFIKNGLLPLYGLKKLKEFITRNNFETKDFALLEYNRPDIKCKYAHVYRQWEGYEYFRCKKCGTYKIEFCGKEIKRKIFCTECNKNKVDELTKRYNEIINMEKNNGVRPNDT